MNKKIEQILNDLYMIDDSFKSQEEELIKIIEELLMSKPDTKIDQDFVFNLRQELLSKTLALKSEKGRFFNNLLSGTNFMMHRKFYYAVGSLTVLIGVASATYYLGILPNMMTGSEQPSEMIFKYQINKVADNAFGQLSLGPDGSMSARPQSGGGGGGLGGGAGVAMESSAVDSKMIAPEIWNYVYKYAGDDIEFMEKKGAVYRKINEKSQIGDLSQIVKSFKFDTFNISRLSNVKISNLNLIEDRDFGYSLFVDFLSGYVSISTNWEKWPKVAFECRDETCFNSYRLKLGDVPSDEEILAAADKFLKDYNIDTAIYGPGQVQKDFDRQPMPLTELGQSSEIYVPDRVNVVYPLMIDGKQIFENYGAISGMNVDFDVRNKKVAGAYYSFFKKYESSDYDMETDFEKIKRAAERGGVIGNYENPNPTKVIEIKLGTPSRELSKVYNYNQSTGEYQELIAPAMVFPVMNQKEMGFYQKYIIVSLVAGLGDNPGMIGGGVGGMEPIMMQK